MAAGCGRRAEGLLIPIRTLQTTSLRRPASMVREYAGAPQQSALPHDKSGHALNASSFPGVASVLLAGFRVADCRLPRQRLVARNRARTHAFPGRVVAGVVGPCGRGLMAAGLEDGEGRAAGVVAWGG